MSNSKQNKPALPETADISADRQICGLEEWVFLDVQILDNTQRHKVDTLNVQFVGSIILFGTIFSDSSRKIK